MPLKGCFLTDVLQIYGEYSALRTTIMLYDAAHTLGHRCDKWAYASPNHQEFRYVQSATRQLYRVFNILAT